MIKQNDILAVAGLFVIVLLVWLFGHHQAPVSNEQTVVTPTPMAVAHYACDKGKFIDAAFYEGSTTTPVQPGQPPVPTGTADVALDGAATTTLHQTLSADGARYANADESFVFWNKGNEALIMRNNSMDLTYTNCVTPKG